MFRSVASILRHDRYRHIKLRLSLKLARLQALCHHATELSFEICGFLGVDLFLLSRNDDVLFLRIRPIRRVVYLGRILRVLSKRTSDEVALQDS